MNRKSTNFGIRRRLSKVWSTHLQPGSRNNIKWVGFIPSYQNYSSSYIINCDLYIWGKWADPKMPIYGHYSNWKEKRQCARCPAQWPSGPPTVRKRSLLASRMGTLTFLLQLEQLRHRRQRHLPELTWRNIRGDSLNKSWKQSHFRWRQLDSSETATSSRGFLKVLLSPSLSIAGVRARVGEVKPRGFGQYSPVTSPSACLENSNYRDREQRWIIETLYLMIWWIRDISHVYLY